MSSAIRLATPTDCIELAEMSRLYIEHGLRWRWKPSGILRLIRNPDASVIVSDRLAKPAAFAAMEFHAEHAHLNLLAVRPDNRRKGMGLAMLGWLEESARIAGLTQISLEVRRDNPGAIQFYENAGYEVAEVRPGYYEGKIDAVSMVHHLISADQAARRPK